MKLGNTTNTSELQTRIITQRLFPPRKESPASINKNLLKNRNRNFSHSALFHIKTRVCLKTLGNSCKSRHGHKYSIKSVSVSWCLSIKQHLSNMRSLINELNEAGEGEYCPLTIPTGTNLIQ